MEQVPGWYDYRTPPVPLDELRRADERSRLGTDRGAGESFSGPDQTLAPGGNTPVEGERGGFWARIQPVDAESYYSSGQYSFVEVDAGPDGTATNARTEMGRFGVHDSREWNGAQVPENVVVWMTQVSAYDRASTGCGFAFVYYGPGFAPPDGPVDVDEITADTPALTLPPGSTFYLTSDGGWTVSSIIPPDADAPDGYEIRLINNNDPVDADGPAPWAITLVHLDDTAPAQFRIDAPGGLDQALWPRGELVLRLHRPDAGGPVWRLANAPGGPPPGPPPPALASPPTLTPGTGSVFMTWAASAGPPPSTAYMIFRAAAADMAGGRLVAVVDDDNPFGLQLRVGGLADAVPVYFRIAAVGALGGISGLSASANATPTTATVLGELAREIANITCSAAGNVKNNGTLSRTIANLTISATGAVVNGDPPPCSSGNTYTVVVSGSTAADGTYNLTFVSAQTWSGSGGGCNVGLDLSPSPVTLDLVIPFTATAHYEAASFSCGGGGLFTRTSDTGGHTWPATLTVTNP